MSQPDAQPPWRLAATFVAVAALPLAMYWWLGTGASTPPSPELIQDWFYAWWDEIPKELRAGSTGNNYSNIAPDDYVGPETCGKCHQENYEKWSHHPHRWMNAAATPETVKGRFDGSTLDVRGGTATMYQADGHYWMRLQRGEHLREFRITHTIGSRLQQYYIAILHSGEPFDIEDKQRRQARRTGAGGTNVEKFGPDTRIVLPVGFRIAEDRWAPTYSVLADNDTDSTPDPFESFQPTAYYDSCAKCHTTMPQGYRMILDNNSVALGKPKLHFALGPFFTGTLNHMIDRSPPSLPGDAASLNNLVREVSTSYTPERAVALGISCEACHYGGAAHAESGGDMPPRFFPSSPHLVPAGRRYKDYGRTTQNLNLVCAQCHSAPRSTLPGGPASVNSSEFRDALSGSCYSQLTCVECHEPHTAIGKAWSDSPEQDDARCLNCHSQFEPVPARTGHTHHPLGSPGSRCMNCHMPKINEGLEDLVRTHQISSPTSTSPIYAGGANACNVCHLDQSIDWTLGHLTGWYGAQYDDQRIARTYTQRDQALGLTWLKHRNSSMRMVALGAAKRSGATWLAPLIIDELDDMHLINRQFAQDTLESIMEIDLLEFGYAYWLMPQQRKATLDEVRRAVSRKVRSKPGF